MSDEEIIKDNTAEYLAGWKRALADYDNLKKDLSRERGDMRANAIADAVMRIIPVLDNFDVATRFVPEEIDEKLRNWLTGILFIQTQLEEAIKGMGAEPYGSVGDPFDANLHDAVGEREDATSTPGTILEIVARGWKIADRVVRPAKVITRTQ
ncbi:nucleotide exchange factor GrpE [Candidatus Uhrbacteria bacterium RIFOXYB12_FULL_58_10]|uniref:Protein GrpE n=1 Tax=Candidatus Uhrbacteria bacterium RIFOXYB2_FULL_57_15 TaxID=1802422 RepID=A0A1F7W898_9BACT|nr:MAG: nucleotide exchange factor GrpE [Candidatus Uhrbacteria bacterium RIFOXYB12_FULL_58_10]OGL98447.1 MAG: nucleotide exchange factor GrpE [Candidatus Uhrbacteria bacterium RIFOXYB2_FULL_57_15]OGL99238.1 MAG: nucleotide exchange factor GrpE [Candidatus Uhrbacteria bacterium RIFOXYC12_FULL_57_11]